MTAVDSTWQLRNLDKRPPGLGRILQGALDQSVGGQNSSGWTVANSDHAG